MINQKRLIATIDGDFVVFLIGMRLNQPWKVHKWGPVAAAMPRMISELRRQPKLGFLHAEMWFSRTIIMVQYWRSMDQLMAYATSKQATHLPAWKAFNQSVGTDGSVGIWHETFSIAAGGYESVYVNMPPFGLGRAGKLEAATGRKHSATDRRRGTIPHS
jgi:GH15 family glucan-1,4-alpha-glucosidase